MRIVPRVICFFLAVFAAPRYSLGQECFTDGDRDSIAVFLRENFADSSAGMVIGLLDQEGSNVLSEGKLANNTEQSVDGTTLFEIGSVTKPITVLLLLDMVKRGEIQLDDPVAKYLPARVQMPMHDGKAITLLNLAVQDSGLPFNPDNFADAHWVDAYNGYTVGDLYSFLSSYDLNAEPGIAFEYSNVGMALLGHVMERQSGKSFESLVKKRILQPLSMNDTTITLTPDLASRVAMGHDKQGKPALRYQLQAIAPAGALLATANDLLKFLAANLGIRQTDLTPLLNEMQVVRHEGSARFGRTAMPWFDEGVYNPPGSELLGHAGGSPGCASFVGFDTKRRRGVVILSNQTTLRPAAVGWRILQGMPLTNDNTLVREYVGIGIGLDIDEKSGMVRIAQVWRDSSAGRAGLSAGLIIHEINGIAVRGKGLQESIRIMKGPVGTEVRLVLKEPGEDETRTVKLTNQKFLTVDLQ